MFLATIDEMADGVATSEHENRLEAMVADQEASGWIVRKMYDDEEGNTITIYRSDRHHLGISVIGENLERIKQIAEELLEELE